MQTMIRRALALTLIAAATAGAQAQSGAPAAAPTFPSVGEAAPDFTATATDSTGKAWPVSLASLKGRVAVLAFYPADRSSGCTIEMDMASAEQAVLKEMNRIF